MYRLHKRTTPRELPRMATRPLQENIEGLTHGCTIERAALLVDQALELSQSRRFGIIRNLVVPVGRRRARPLAVSE